MAITDLKKQDYVEENDTFECEKCGQTHSLTNPAGDPDGTLVYRCSGDTLVAAVNNQPVTIED